MALTPSTMLPLATRAPEFTLPDACSDKLFSLSELKSETATVIMFICNHCPYVKLLQNKLVEVANKYMALKISFIAINSNDVKNYPDDNPERMKETAEFYGYPFPYLFDETQAVAKAYQAACTPDFYIFDSKMLCVYRGRFDDATPGNHQPVTGKDLSQALDCILAGRAVPEDQQPSVGCNIKWKR
jgi:peroxiredoxin